MLIIPGHDSKNGNTNSFLYKTYGSLCSEYVLDKPLENQPFVNADSECAVVHSYGFFIFLAGLKKGLFKNVNSLVVFDGWFPNDCKFMSEEISVEDLPNVPTTFFFPTVGNRRGYPLESIVRKTMISRNNITIARGIGFGHNLLYQNFDTKKADELVNYLCKLSDYLTIIKEVIITFPNSKIL